MQMFIDYIKLPAAKISRISWYKYNIRLRELHNKENSFECSNNCRVIHVSESRLECPTNCLSIR